jgi:microcystin-dependent protein
LKAFQQTGTLTPPTLTASVDDYAPSGLSGTSVLRLAADARRTITGLTGVASGRIFTVFNIGNFPIVFSWEDTNSVAANRFAFACTLGGGQSLEMIYDGTSARWRAKNLPEPIGTIKDFGTSTMPGGFLPCDGAAISRATYAALFNEIGTVWGIGDGSTTFNVPPPGRLRVGTGTPTTTEDVTASSANGFTVAANTRKWNTGMPVVLSNLTGFTTSATAGPTYYVVRVSNVNVRLATTIALALKETPDITISGTGTATLTYTGEAKALGEVGGEDSHATSVAELPAHTHTEGTPSSGTSFNMSTSGSGGSTINSGSTGGNAAGNIQSPYKAVTEGVRYV